MSPPLCPPSRLPFLQQRSESGNTGRAGDAGWDSVGIIVHSALHGQPPRLVKGSSRIPLPASHALIPVPHQQSLGPLLALYCAQCFIPPASPLPTRNAGCLPHPGPPPALSRSIQPWWGAPRVVIHQPVRVTNPPVNRAFPERSPAIVGTPSGPPPEASAQTGLRRVRAGPALRERATAGSGREKGRALAFQGRSRPFRPKVPQLCRTRLRL